MAYKVLSRFVYTVNLLVGKVTVERHPTVVLFALRVERKSAMHYKWWKGFNISMLKLELFEIGVI